MTAPSKTAARLALLLATAIWGATFVVVQRALAEIPVLHLLAFRFTLGGLLLLPLARGGWTRQLARDGLAVGLLLFGGFVLQTSGLLWTTPSRSAFLTGLSVLLVPLLGWVARTERPRLGPVAGALCAALGLWVLYRPGAGGAPFNLGDALTIGCAVVFAGHLILVGRAVRRQRVVPLAVAQFAVVAALSSPALLLDPPAASELRGYALFAILITGVFATAACFLCQLYAQQRLSAVEAAVILTLEPVFAAATSVLLGAERWSPSLAIGGGLIVTAMLLSEMGDRSAPQPPARQEA